MALKYTTFQCAEWCHSKESPFEIRTVYHFPRYLRQWHPDFSTNENFFKCTLKNKLFLGLISKHSNSLGLEHGVGTLISNKQIKQFEGVYSLGSCSEKHWLNFRESPELACTPSSERERERALSSRLPTLHLQRKSPEFKTGLLSIFRERTLNSSLAHTPSSGKELFELGISLINSMTQVLWFPRITLKVIQMVSNELLLISRSQTPMVNNESLLTSCSQTQMINNELPLTSCSQIQKVNYELPLISCSQTCLATALIMFWEAMSPWVIKFEKKIKYYFYNFRCQHLTLEIKLS